MKTRAAEQQIDLKLTAYLSNFLRRKWALGDNRDFHATAQHKLNVLVWERNDSN
jgi:hypothetical protein